MCRPSRSPCHHGSVRGSCGGELSHPSGQAGEHWSVRTSTVDVAACFVKTQIDTNGHRNKKSGMMQFPVRPQTQQRELVLSPPLTLSTHVSVRARVNRERCTGPSRDPWTLRACGIMWTLYLQRHLYQAVLRKEVLSRPRGNSWRGTQILQP